MIPAPGEIYLIDLGVIGKVRPAIIVSRADANAPRAIALCVPLTTACRHSQYEVSLGKPRFLDKASWANVQGLTSIEHTKLLRRLGRASAEQMSEIKQAMRFLLEI